MPEYLHPGVYIAEVAAGAKPIDGVSTSTADLRRCHHDPAEVDERQIVIALAS